MVTTSGLWLANDHCRLLMATKVRSTRKLLILLVWPSITIAIDSMVSLVLALGNMGVMLHRDVDSLATLPGV